MTSQPYRKSQQEAGFPDARVTDKEKFEKIVTEMTNKLLLTSYKWVITRIWAENLLVGTHFVDSKRCTAKHTK